MEYFILLSIIVVLLFLYFISKNKEAKRNNISLKDGFYRKYYDFKININDVDFAVEECGTYKNGLKQDEWKYYYTNGNLYFLKNYLDGKLNGKYQEFAQNEVLIKIGYYRNDEKDNNWIEYYSNGKEKQNLIFNNGKIISCKQYDENGKLSLEYNDEFINCYHKNGIIDYQEIKNSKINDVYYSKYNLNCDLIEQRIKTNNKEIIQILYSEEGNKFGEGKIKTYEGLKKIDKIGKWTYFHTNGKIESVGEYYDCYKKGLWNYYDEKGNLIHEINEKWNGYHL